MSALIRNSTGNYRILPSGVAYCAAVVPDPGFEVVRAQLRPWLPLEQAYAFIEDHLKRVGRPVQAFCGIEMRVPAPLSFDQWSSFNVPYLEQLSRWRLRYGEYSGVCRSNIALALHAPPATSVCAFSYTAPATSGGATFLLSGQADIDRGGRIVAEGDTSGAAMQQRARFTIETIGACLGELGFSWRDTTQLAIFHVHEIPDLWGPSLLGGLGEAVARGVLCYRARPPIAGGEVELEARAVRHELVASTS